MKRSILLLLTATVLAIAPAWARKAPKKFVHETVAIPEVAPKVIAVETDHTQLLLQVDKKGSVRTVHYGVPTGEAAQFVSFRSGYGSLYGSGPMTYPTVGGRFIGQPALQVKYADGTHNTELYYVSHETVSRSGAVTTTLHLKDYVTALEVSLGYEAFQAEDVILMHSEVVNGGKKAVELLDVASASLNLDAGDYLLTHFYGDWAMEMQVERTPLTHGVTVIESRRGTQGTQNTNPSFLLSCGKVFSETEGEVIGGALAWSGNYRLSFEKNRTDRLNIVTGISPPVSALLPQPIRAHPAPALRPLR